MARLSEINDRKFIISTIDEFDTAGEVEFLSKYGFSKSRNYFLLYNGKEYPSKAILGVAYKYIAGSPLKSIDFSGGRNTVKKILDNLGFKIIYRSISDETVSLPEEVPQDLPEGAKQTITVNKYERSAIARRKCIEHYGYKCFICNFDMGEFYGEEYTGFIHVHHIKPLSEINSEYIVDPVKDLIPLCPNCHAIIHHHKPTLDIQELKNKINQINLTKT